MSIGIDNYQIEAWIIRLGSMPIQRIAHQDLGQNYAIRQAHALKLENGKYALVIEDGCSCYDPSKASIEIHPTKTSVIKAFEGWVKENRGMMI